MTLQSRLVPVLTFLVALGCPAWAQEGAGVGVVTVLTGKADVKRPQAPQAPLKLRDNLFVRDVVDTREQSLARILLMGKSSVTVRELSRFEIREETRPDGTQRALIDLAAGKIRVMVAPRLMKPGDEVQIRTPNAVAAVRGSDGIIEVATLPDGRPETSVLVVSGKFEMAAPSTRPIAMAETVVSDAPAGIRVAQAAPGITAGASQVVVVTGPPGLQQVVQRFDPGAVNTAAASFRLPGVASGTGARSEPNGAAITATMEALAQFQATTAGEQPGVGASTSPSPTTTTESTTTTGTTTTTTIQSVPPPTETTSTTSPTPSTTTFDQLSPGNQQIAQALCNALADCNAETLDRIASMKVDDGLGWGPIWQQMKSEVGLKDPNITNVGRAVSQFVLIGGNVTRSGVFNVLNFANSSRGLGRACAGGAHGRGKGAQAAPVCQ